MNTTDPVELLKQMLEIYSPSGKENKLAIFLKEKLTQMGFQNVRLDKVDNVYGEVGTGSKTILLCVHMDTVPGYLPVKVEDGKVYGRGAVDAKSSLASMIVASSELVTQEMNGKIMVACVVDEERKARGIRQMLREKLSVDYAIFGEPSGVNNITIGYKGRLGVKILCKTEPGHAGAPQAFKNAIEEAYGLWSKIKKRLLESQSSLHSPYQSVTACLTGMWGGEAFNVVPSTCKLKIDMRLPLRFNCEKGISLLRAVVQQYQLDRRVKLKMTIEDKIEPFLANKDSTLVRALTWAIKDTVGEPVKLLKKTGTGDMNIFATKMNVPVATYGPGNSHLSHTLNEYVEISEYLASIKVYRKTIERLLSL